MFSKLSFFVTPSLLAFGIPPQLQVGSGMLRYLPSHPHRSCGRGERGWLLLPPSPVRPPRPPPQSGERGWEGQPIKGWEDSK